MDSKDEYVKKPEWATDDFEYIVIETDTPSYDHMTSEAGGRGQQLRKSTVLYDSLALTYNRMAPGDLLVVALPNRPSTSNLRKTIENRGLQEKDYRLFSPTFDKHGQRYPKHKRPLALQRISHQKMRTVHTFTALAESIAKEAEQRGISNNFSYPESPVDPGPI
ncbi:hypothetical protein [Pseudomonas tumuqii]|uniref:hypothetical protein n=1 Tax=Pseudomonas tumuqii TaxID=2715755 RepID=UPI001552606B|nr:hypothetical protein [Pseudomonas tumuqii]